MDTERDDVIFGILLAEIESLRQLIRINIPLIPKHLPTCDINIIGEEAACNCGLQRALRDE